METQDWKNELKDSQSAGGDYPKLSIDFRIQSRKKDGKSIFSYYDGEKSIDTTDTLEGILIGSVMKITAFDNGFGSKGGSYNSSYFVEKTNRIALFTPSGKNVTGNYDSLCDFIQKDSIDNTSVSIKRAILIATQNGVLVVETNIVLDIEQMNSFDKFIFTGKIIKVSPALYEKDDARWSKYAHKKLKIAQSSLAYTKIEVGQDITKDIWDSFKASEKVKMFKTWKVYMKNDNSEKEAIENIEKATQEKVDNFERPSSVGGAPLPTNPPDFTEEESDDFPF